MDQRPQYDNPRKQTRTSKRKVKSGCRTCKIRRVKCDESKPACRRCVSTGRVCDGYGIWGGGGSVHATTSAPTSANGIATATALVDSSSQLTQGKTNVADVALAVSNHVVTSPAPLPMTVSIPVIKATAEELEHYAWFKCRSAIKLPGAFESGFWETLVFQASCSEPAVLHAVVALSSVDRMVNAYEDGCGGREEDYSEEGERFTLRQYSNAICCLQPHLATKDREALRVVLITCVLFVSLEFLRGHYGAGVAHLQNGLKLLEESWDGFSATKKSNSDATDFWILEIFLRLRLQARLFGQGTRFGSIFSGSFEVGLPALTFRSIAEARLHLDQLLGQIVRLNELSDRHVKENCLERLSLTFPSKLYETKSRIQADLASWLTVFEASEVIFQSQMNVLDRWATRMLRIYHIMAHIMAHACLSSCETIYDAHTAKFLSIIEKSIDIYKFGTLEGLFQPSLDQAQVSGSIADSGWIPPLFYTAMKCRVHRIREQAIRLIDSVRHKEGIWDAGLAATIAKEVMEMEERRFYDACPSEPFPLWSIPKEEELSGPVLPEPLRMQKVQIVLPNDSWGKAELICGRKQGAGDRRTVI